MSNYLGDLRRRLLRSAPGLSAPPAPPRPPPSAHGREHQGRQERAPSPKGGVRRPQRLSSLLSARSVAGEVFLLQLAVVVVLVAAAVLALVVQARSSAMLDARHRTLAAAGTFAESPGMVAALHSAHPSAVLQPSAEAARKIAGVDGLNVYTLDGVTLAHSDPRQIGKRVVGPFATAAAGRSFTETFAGSLGQSVVSVVPVKDARGDVIAVVSSPVTVQNVQSMVNGQLPVVLGSAAGVLVLSAGGTALVSRRLLRRTHGLGPAEMTRMYEHHDAVLHAVREGVLIVGDGGRLLLANDEARRLLDLPGDAEGRPLADLGLEEGIVARITAGRTATDEVHMAADRLLAVNIRPTAPYGSAGTVVTLRDTTELRALSGKAEVARERLNLLYDAGVRVGTTLDVERTAQELAEVAVPRFAAVVTVDLLEPVLRGEEPPETTTEMRRTAAVGLRGDHPLYPVGRLIRFVPDSPMAMGLARGHAILEADLRNTHHWRAQDPANSERILARGIHSLIAVPLRARGVVLGMAGYWRGPDSPAFDQEDVSFAEELTARAALSIDNARRYTREHTVADTLQRSLLPRGVPEQSAVEVAHRYLSAKAGVGGDWFDVIPLPGARVALVVGDVVGHGLYAAATMGRLRTAVYNFSTLDLPPDELLSHLDELVAHIDTDQQEWQGITGATCLCAVYDPVSGQVTAATAGHPGPALVHPDGTVTFPEVPVSPPLGLGEGLPMESAELTLPEGSLLALFTDGLIEGRGRDPDAGLTALRGALSGPVRTPEETCTAVIEAVLPTRPSDDIALLVARTRRLDPARIAEWEVSPDPAEVSRVRNACARRLSEWGLDDIAFTTELILSELITNAIRYGTEPIRVRLLYDRGLICEVSDGSSTSPHLRRAADTDEGGRGLFLVAQFAQRWGTRYTARGKIIWSEQALHEGGPEASLSAELPEEALLAEWDEEPL
ncbi:SpoIIE family protein phosphatase [Streptomyces sp. SPB4]|uniref:SpoIIE family protein phosphatase n=1 Tax=Streptomyces sp. SPB4 TaxID=2940553 RepID=UPI002475E5C5|nr:SpoIIE family protein phosphatase [Streptomyces sp. SPB4]MDH6537705.1 serine phosphatase RsbU (regulator of sigma subunit)/PAS domain-containing protein/anti-sigma regulatory factor (Ser/Thr protein kinase) [Streptomyces sp. SPB4]